MGALLLARTDPTPSQQRALDRITRAGDRAVRLIRDLLDFTQARLGTGLAVTRKAVDVHALIAETVDDLAQAFPGRKLRHVETGTGQCLADGDRLAQLVGNLVANAMAYGRPEAPVTVTSSIGPALFWLAVHNEGTPIPPETLPGLFQPMARGDNAGASAGRSVGLGLFIVSEIARAQGGSVSVESTAQAGTTFSAAFPRA
jgi:sigma-B regulation protein RsbU (phosphoserine phosphatase)